MKRQWSFRKLPADFKSTSSWKKVDVEALSDQARSRFLRLQNAIEAYLASGRLTDVSEQFHVSRHNLLRLLNRCLETDHDGLPVGWSALIPGRRIAPHSRSQPRASGVDIPQGSFAGCFKSLLTDYPEIKGAIDDLIFKKKGNGRVHESLISLKNLHAIFVGLCERAGVRGDQYPFNSKSMGIRSLGRYMNDSLNRLADLGVMARGNKTAQSRMSVGTGIQSAALFSAPYDIVGLDAHRLDCIGTVRIQGPAGSQRVAIERIWIVPVVDGCSRAILGYSVGIRSECNAAKIEEAILSAMATWAPRRIKVPNLKYMEKAGLPSGVYPTLSGRGWAGLMVDNAAAHYAHAIAERVRRRIGCAFNYGPVGHWEHRAALERVMKTLELYGFQRLPSSTGSSPADSRRNNPVQQAINVGIDWEHLLDLIDVVVANYNATPNEAIGNRSPLSLLGDYVLTDPMELLLRRLPAPSANQPALGINIQTREIRGSREEGRRPYVELDRVRYTNPVLASSMGLIGKKLRLHVCESNMCSFEAFHESGESLGILTAQGPWGRTPHTREMRKIVNGLKHSGQLTYGPDDDPIHKLLEFYASEAHREAEKNPAKVSKAATKLVQAAVSADQPIPPVPPAPARQELTLAEPKVKPSVLIKKPVWKTIIS